jgi:aspartate racemase
MSMQIGLIGGIGPAATDFYYRRLIRVFAEKLSPLELTIAHADTPTLLGNLSRNQAAAQAQIFASLTERLAAAGAGFVAVTSIAGHFCRKEFEALSPLPVVDMIDEVGRVVAERGVRRIGIMGTRTVMETRFYGGATTATVLPPGGADLDRVHEAYVAMALAGTVTDAQREIFQSAARRLIEEQGAEAIMLGGTDLALVFDEQSTPYPLIDCAAIHVDAIASRAIT